MKVLSIIQLALAAALCLLLNNAYSFESDISYLGHLTDGGTGNLGETIDGLNGAIDVVVSSSGKVYVAGFVDDAVAVFNLNRSTNQLEQVQVLKNGVNNVSGLNGISALALSLDESQLYATSLYDKSFVIFNVDSSGLLSQAQVFTEGDVDSFGRTIDGMSRLFDSGNTDIAVSDDGLFVYVANQYAGGAIFKKDTSDNSFYSIEPNQHSGMIGTRAGLLTSNHQDLYTVNTTVDAVYHYSRDAQSGLLTFVQRFDDGSAYPELTNPRHLSSNTDESILVVSGITDDSLVVFDRTIESGVISYSYALKNGSTDSLGNTISSIVGPMSTAFNHIGTKLISANYDADSLGLFSSQSGTPISFSGSIDSNETIGGSQLSSFDGPRAIHFTQDDQFFVVASYVSDSIHLFYDQDVDEDGIVNDQDPTPNGEGTGNNGDQDGDGVADEEDAFPTDPTEWSDQDGDGVGDNSDAFPTNPEEWSDQDGDNVGDNSDQFPTDPTEWSDQDGDGVGDNSDDYPTHIGISVKSDQGHVILAPGQSGNIQTSVDFYSKGGIARTISISQEIQTVAGQPSGISLDQMISINQIVSLDQAWSYNQSLTTISEGVYNVVTTAEIIETGETAQTAQRITVKSVSDEFDMRIVGVKPLSLKPNTATKIALGVDIRSEDITTAVDVVIEGDLALALNDDGIGADTISKNGSYWGSVTVDTSNLQPGTCLQFRARGIRGAIEKLSEYSSICISSYDPLPGHGPIDETVIDPNNGETYIADEITLYFNEGTTESEINTVAESVNASVYGWNPLLGAIYIRLDEPAADMAVLNSTILSIKSNATVSKVEKSGIGSLSGSTSVPKDVFYETDQWHLRKAKFNEAWNLGYYGTRMIAIVDSGIDYSHPDLKSKVVLGGDYVDGDDPIDTYGHGTFVAGIASAETNNGKGIAGASWNSTLLAIRMTDGLEFKLNNAISGLSEAVNSEAEIINASFGSYMGIAKEPMCKLADAASANGKIIVTSAGNDGTDAPIYPAFCSSAIAVAAANESDAQWVDSANNRASNYGDHIDVAAPGSDIKSTALYGLYVVSSGTSLAAPQVSGAIAVILDKFPDYSPAEAAQRLIETVDPIDPVLKLGAGRINVFRAVADHGIIAASPSVGSKYVVSAGSEWVSTELNESTSGISGNLDWKGQYRDGLATEVISWVGPKSRYFGGVAKTYNEINNVLEITKALEYGYFVLREGKVLAKAPGPVLGAGIHKDSENKKWIVVATINPSSIINPYNYTDDIFYIKPFEYSIDDSLYDDTEHPNGWREVARLPRNVDEEFHGGWFFNGNSDKASNLRYIVEEAAPSNQLSKLDLQLRTFNLNSLTSGSVSIQNNTVAGAVDYLDDQLLTLNITSQKWLSINDGPPLIPNEELNTYCFDHIGYYAGDDCAFGTATDGTITNKGIFGYIISRASEQPGGVFVYGLDLRSETLLYSITDLDPDHNTYLYPRDVTYRIRHNGSVLYSEDLGTVDCVSITGYYDRFLFDYEWGSFDFIPDVYASFDRKLHCPTYSFDYLAEMGPIPEFQFAVGIFGELLSSQTFFDDSIRNFVYPSANLSELFGENIGSNLEAFTEIGAY